MVKTKRGKDCAVVSCVVVCVAVSCRGRIGRVGACLWKNVCADSTANGALSFKIFYFHTQGAARAVLDTYGQ